MRAWEECMFIAKTLFGCTEEVMSPSKSKNIERMDAKRVKKATNIEHNKHRRVAKNSEIKSPECLPSNASKNIARRETKRVKINVMNDVTTSVLQKRANSMCFLL